MSKSMWIPTEQNNLPISYNEHPQGDVLFWVEGETLPHWGHYDYTLNVWFCPDKKFYYDSYRVEYFAYIDNPYK